jgi:hypothetical protein
MRVRLTKKYAEMIDGIDLRPHKPGDTLDLGRPQARLLIAEGWAVREGPRRYMSAASIPASAAKDRPRPKDATAEVFDDVKSA